MQTSCEKNAAQCLRKRCAAFIIETTMWSSLGTIPSINHGCRALHSMRGGTNEKEAFYGRAARGAAVWRPAVMHGAASLRV